MIAVTIHLSPFPTAPSGLSASDIVAICSVVVAAFAFALSVYVAWTQRRHNMLMARPHMDVDLGVHSCLLKITNHGPGVSRLHKFDGTADGRTYNFLTESGVEEFCQWLVEGMEGNLDLNRNLLNIGSSFAANFAIEMIVMANDLNESDIDLLESKLKKLTFKLSYSCIFGKFYSEDVRSFQA